jgi:hypothetical protein
MASLPAGPMSVRGGKPARPCAPPPQTTLQQGFMAPSSPTAATLVEALTDVPGEPATSVPVDAAVPPSTMPLGFSEL